jgi:hypothetical protein
LILDAHASHGPDLDQRRPDSSVEEVAEGRTLLFAQEDNLFGKVMYRMHIKKATSEGISFDVENSSAVRYLTIPVFPAGRGAVGLLSRQRGR